MRTLELNYAGAIAFWGLSDGTKLEDLREGFTNGGLAECVPDALDDMSALRRALQAVFPARSHKIQRLETQGMNRKGFAIGKLVEKAGEDKLEWNQEMLVRLFYPASAGGAARLAFIASDQLAETRVKQNFTEEKEMVPAAKLGEILVKAVETVQGISLRPRGGFYWLAEEDLDRWNTIAAAVEGANGGNSMYLLRTTTDPETLEAICDAVTNQVDNKLEKLVEDLGNDELDLGSRALESRRRSAQELAEFAERYEGLFEFNLQRLRDKADEVAATALVAIQSLS